MINIVIPMAGQGSRFLNAGYDIPKPFIEVNGTPLIEIVLENLRMPDARYILLVRQEHIKMQEKLFNRLSKKFDITLVSIKSLTEGAACTVLHAHRLINNDIPLLLANSDQFIEASAQNMVIDAKQRSLDGSIMTFYDEEKNPKWSFAKIDTDGLVLEVQEKRPISHYATVGLYFFSKGRFFVDAAIDMIASNQRINGEFYTCPVYNYCINENLKIGIFNIPATAMHGLGTPEDLQKFVNRT